jgi:hypothetical protein
MADIGRDWDDELVPERSRTFKVGGELFEWMYPHWEVGAKLFDDDLDPAQSNGDAPAQFSFVADTTLAIERIPMFLNPKNDAVKRFKALAARKTDPVPRYQFVQIYRWLVEVTGGLPTTAPSSAGSADGDGETAPASSAATPSTEAPSTA